MYVLPTNCRSPSAVLIPATMDYDYPPNPAPKAAAKQAHLGLFTHGLFGLCPLESRRLLWRSPVSLCQDQPFILLRLFWSKASQAALRSEKRLLHCEKCDWGMIWLDLDVTWVSSKMNLRKLGLKIKSPEGLKACIVDFFVRLATVRHLG